MCNVFHYIMSKKYNNRSRLSKRGTAELKKAGGVNSTTEWVKREFHLQIRDTYKNRTSKTIINSKIFSYTKYNQHKVIEAMEYAKNIGYPATIFKIYNLSLGEMEFLLYFCKILEDVDGQKTFTKNELFRKVRNLTKTFHPNKYIKTSQNNKRENTILNALNSLVKKNIITKDDGWEKPFKMNRDLIDVKDYTTTTEKFLYDDKPFQQPPMLEEMGKTIMKLMEKDIVNKRTDKNQ